METVLNDTTGTINPRVTVKFDSITINNDYDHFGIQPATCRSGEWTMVAFVQGQLVKLFENKGDINDGDAFNFSPDKQVAANKLRSVFAF